LGPAVAQQQGADSLPFLNPPLALEQRVDDLPARLTMEKKAGQLVNQAAAIPRLHIPAYNCWNESLHGLVSQNTTVFPQVIGLGATFNAPLIQ
jgi:beta-glucosidase